jgi:hypothetical protein
MSSPSDGWVIAVEAPRRYDEWLGRWTKRSMGWRWHTGGEFPPRTGIKSQAGAGLSFRAASGV